MRVPNNIQPLTDDQKRLFDQYLPDARKFAYQFSNHLDWAGTELEDEMQSAAMLGLMIAVTKPCRNCRFSTSLFHWVRFAMMRRSGEITSDTSSSCKKRKSRRALHLAEYLIMRGRAVKGYGSDPASSDRPVENQVEDRELAERLIRFLPPMEQEVVVRHAVGGEKINDIGESLGVSRNRAYWYYRSGINRARRAALREAV